MTGAAPILFAGGVRIGPVTIDPSGRVDSAFWTHRPARRPAAKQTLASQVLAATWSNALGLPFGRGALALGHRIELLPTGYGVGGAALLMTRDGDRTLVVGPTTEALTPRMAQRLVLHAPAPPEASEGWWEELESGTRLVVPDDGAAIEAVSRLEAVGVPARRPAWLGPSPRAPVVTVTTRGPGVPLDLRPQASEDWLFEFALQCAPELVCVHGPRSQQLTERLAAAGLGVRVLHGPEQLALGGL